MNFNISDMFRHTLIMVLCCIVFVACHHKTTIETEQVSLSKSYCLTDACNDSLELQFELEFPTVLENEESLKLIQCDLIKKFFGDDYSLMSIDEALQAYLSFSYNEYIANNRAFAEHQEEGENEGAVLSEQQVLTGRVFSAEDGVLTYELERYVYMGGAHGINTRFFYNYCMETGKLLTESDIFKSGFEQSVTKLIQQSVVEQSEEFDSKEQMTEVGYEFDNICPNNNFALTHDAVIYVFNPYEIAPYVFGETEVVLEKEMLKSWLNE